MTKLPPDKFAHGARLLSNGLLVDWRTRVLRPYKMLPPIAELLRTVASLFEAVAAATGDGHWLAGREALLRSVEAMREPELERVRELEKREQKFVAASAPDKQVDTRPGRFAPPANIPPRKRTPARATLAKFAGELVDVARRSRKP